MYIALSEYTDIHSNGQDKCSLHRNINDDMYYPYVCLYEYVCQCVPKAQAEQVIIPFRHGMCEKSVIELGKLNR